MHFEFLVEEPSAEAALPNILPRILGSHTFVVHVFEGKPNLRRSLPNRLRGYRRWLPMDWRVVVLIDSDNKNCHALKEELEQAAKSAGFLAKSSCQSPATSEVMNRLAIEELEAWFFGDVEAICQAYPGVPKHLHRRARFRDLDAIQGGTWEALQRVLQRAGYFTSGFSKRKVARDISRFMEPDRNRSKSFQVFRDGLRAMIGC